MRVGFLRGRENSFPDAVIAKINSMGRGVTGEYIQLGGTKLNEPVPYRVIIDRMSPAEKSVVGPRLRDLEAEHKDRTSAQHASPSRSRSSPS